MIKALALVIDEHKIIRPLEAIEGLAIEYVIVDETFQFTLPYPDIVLTVSDWRAEIARVLLDAKTLNIPSLLFQDGTLDWIIQNEGELYGGTGGPTHFHPILTDKMAVIGHQSARVISSWNDASKVEVVGFPILQNEINEAKKYRLESKKEATKPLNVLITSTRQGWFCERQKTAFIEALQDLKTYFEQQKNVSVNWRLSRNLAEIIGVENEMKVKESVELVPLIKEADLIISAQSTVVVEAMIHGKPVAIIDYLNAPQYYGTAWLINAKSQIASTVESMMKAEPSRMLYQEYQLQDILSMELNAIERSKILIEKMVEFRKENNSIDFPANLLNFNEPFQTIQHTYTTQEIFPAVAQHYEIEKEDLAKLVIRYSHENKRLKEELAKKSFLQFIIQLKNKFFKK
jgi:fructose-specific component phosphotransferase system IIB-like protein